MISKNKPDPEQLGRELADYISNQWSVFKNNVPKGVARKMGLFDDIIDGVNHNSQMAHALEREWELQFWRAKALGTKLP